jgi:integrase
LNNLLCFLNNSVIEMMRKKKHVRFPEEPKDKPIRVLSESELVRVRQAAEPLEGWRGCVARYLVSFMPATGLRAKEIRLARFEDLDLESWTIAVAHPKGERSWASEGHRTVILPSAEAAVQDFLRDRAALLNGRSSEWLIPAEWADGRLPWSEACFRKIVSDLVEASGVRFSLKDFRSTFAQVAKDHGASIESVSRAMRHRSTKTTEAYYARISPKAAFKELRERCSPVTASVASAPE